MLKRFTMIELLVVVSVLFIITSLLSPSFSKVIETAQTTECKVNLRGIYHSIILYTQDNDGYLPGPSGENSSAKYLSEIRYRRSGELHRRSQKLSSFIAPYTDSMIYDTDYSYLPIMICPSNADIVMEVDEKSRASYTTLNPQGVEKPFGDHARTTIDGRYIPIKYSKPLSHVVDPANSGALKDVWDKRQTREFIPDFPAHAEYRENKLYFDGGVETIDAL